MDSFSEVNFTDSLPLSKQAKTEPVSSTMSLQSHRIGTRVAKTTSFAIRGDEKNAMKSANDDAEEIREAYCQIFSLQETVHKNNPLWFLDEFKNAGEIMLQELANEINIKEAPSTEITVAFDGQLHIFKNTRVATFGRYDGCDIRFPSHNTTASSRLHCLLFLLSEINKYIVVDMGSLRGINTEKRSSEKPCVHSMPKARNVLIFDWDEIAILRMGDMKIAINPKECVVCFDHPRQCIFNCGHHATCNNCAGMISNCPICRAPINKIDSAMALKTMAW
ncbi:forkhead associated (FHA) domain-containing protein with RING domain C3CH4 type [Fadolivirus algeromassiliense]|jgi:hypothetical protein|uniref:Forkhead associated (FHA) domain-containing protein with RING domain C3CH4 type n=1 Tax=Fadolivirus FV1/VV64 TaxID=3070911 RepID=A0A7D3UVM0_9VIRU|nr:forkhead associated (FHA) domain-containing protein with RING domain C3CH4 type [Fadolivirus algeromassiliense]QKF94289.1 forkhead associated (FHA) domain-containing protein with RING domain C3CH4 type [Fadolivirus FV1/VV64]